MMRLAKTLLGSFSRAGARTDNRLATLFCVSLAIIAGCTTTSVPEPTLPAANLDVVEEIGFTITQQKVVDEQVDFEYQEAMQLLERGQIDEGIARLQQVIEAAPGMAPPQIDIGVAYHIAGDLEAAETHLNKAIELNPAHPVAHNELGIIYRKTGRCA